MIPTEQSGKREKILAITEVCLGEHGYHGTRLHEIAERVGIQKASLFHYFPSKEELYRAALEVGFGETERVVRGILASRERPREKLRHIVEAYVESVAQHTERARLLLRHSLGDAPRDVGLPDSEPVLDALVDFVRGGQAEGVFADIDPLTCVLAVMGMVVFLFSSAAMLAPAHFGHPMASTQVGLIKAQVVEIAERALLPGRGRHTEEVRPERASAGAM